MLQREKSPHWWRSLGRETSAPRQEMKRRAMMGSERGSPMETKRGERVKNTEEKHLRRKEPHYRAGPRLRPRERRPTARTPTGNARATPASKKEKAESRPLRGTAALSSISTPGPLWSPSPAPWRTSTQRRAVPPWTPWRCPKPPAGGRVRGGAAHRAGSNAANPKRPTANRRTFKPCALPVHPALSATTRVERPRTRTLEALYPDWRGSVISHYICIFFKLTTQGYLYFCIVSV
uniref:Uncharacterized protein n=1 Tax=Gasterosteus aculeatus TaxID=69293 RepID=G3PQ39_GASAC